MYTFIIRYADGAMIECQHVVSVTYNNHGAPATASGKAIAETIYSPGKDIWLKIETGSFSIDGSSVRVIEVQEE